MAFKMSQEFPTASMDITKDFHVLHSAHVYICYSILNAKTYNWLPNSNTHTPATATNKKHLGTSTSLANGHLTGSVAPFVCEIPTASSNKKDNFADIGLDCGDARRLCSSEGMFQAFELVWQAAQSGRFHKTGEPTIRAAMLARNF